MTPLLLVPPTDEPVPLADAKAWLRLDTDDEDALVSALIVASRTLVEAVTRRLLVAQTWRFSLDTWPNRAFSDPLVGVAPSEQTIDLPLAPVSAVAGARIFDAAGLAYPIDPESYALTGMPDAAKLVFMSSPGTPGRSTGGIELDVVAGYGAPADVPQPLKQAVLFLVARAFENRGDLDAAEPQALPAAVAALLAPYRRLRLA